MTRFTKTIAALLAAFILTALAFAALAEAAPYDAGNPQNLAARHLHAQSALLIDADSGEILFSKDGRVRMYPASTTKIMTLLLGIESGIPLDEQVTIPTEAGDIPKGSSRIPVKPGDVISFGDLLYSFMLSSGNDGANAVAVLVDGSIEAFVERMNARAAELGLDDTRYVNAHGYHDKGHYTTALDLACLSRYAMQNETFRDIVAQPNWTITVTRDGETKTAEIISRNSLLQKDEKYYYPDCTGIKTGHHNKAGWCFVGSAERDGMRVICVVLNCEGEFDKWYDAARLFEYGFTRYEDVSAAALLERAFAEHQTVEVSDAMPGEETLSVRLEEVEGGEQAVKVVAGSQSAMDSAIQRFSDGMQIEWTRPLKAPIEAGEALGTLRCETSDGVSVTARLAADGDVHAMPTAEPDPTEAPATVEPTALVTQPPETETGAEPKRPREGHVGMAFAVLIALAAIGGGAAAVLSRQLKRRRAARRRARRRRRASAR